MKCSRKFPEIELTIHNSTRWTFLKMWDRIKQQVKHLVNIPQNVGPNEKLHCSVVSPNKFKHPSQMSQDYFTAVILRHYDFQLLLTIPVKPESGRTQICQKSMIGTSMKTHWFALRKDQIPPRWSIRQTSPSLVEGDISNEKTSL